MKKTPDWNWNPHLNITEDDEEILLSLFYRDGGDADVWIKPAEIRLVDDSTEGTPDDNDGKPLTLFDLRFILERCRPNREDSLAYELARALELNWDYLRDGDSEKVARARAALDRARSMGLLEQRPGVKSKP